MQLRGATASHVGNVRENNQDRAHFGGYVAVVADGMGGHQGGEMAASIAINEFVSVTGPIGPGGLVELVEGANEAVFKKAADPDLRGMGTTLVALTLRPDEEKVSVVNVGDSRAYFLRGGELDQLTLDHSLVEDLVRQKRLTPEEALTHPQRNILTRALGIASHVEVDRFLVPVELGDRFLLCSDGLFNEVPEEEIGQILLAHDEPNEAADALISAALAGAGRDNITVAVIDVVEDGSGGNLSSKAAETLMMPTVSSPPADTIDVQTDGGPEAVNNGFAPDMTTGFDPATTAEQPVLPSDESPDGHEADPATIEENFEAAAPAETAELVVTAPPRKPRRTLRLALSLAVLGVAYAGLHYYATSGWFVGESSDGQVAIFRGKPWGFLWLAPDQDDVFPADVADLSDDAQGEVEARNVVGSRDEAADIAQRLTADAAQAAQQELGETLDETELEGVDEDGTEPAGAGTGPSSGTGGTSTGTEQQGDGGADSSAPSEQNPTTADEESSQSSPAVGSGT